MFNCKSFVLNVKVNFTAVLKIVDNTDIRSSSGCDDIGCRFPLAYGDEIGILLGSASSRDLFSSWLTPDEARLPLLWFSFLKVTMKHPSCFMFANLLFFSYPLQFGLGLCGSSTGLSPRRRLLQSLASSGKMILARRRLKKILAR